MGMGGVGRRTNGTYFGVAARSLGVVKCSHEFEWWSQEFEVERENGSI